MKKTLFALLILCSLEGMAQGKDYKEPAKKAAQQTAKDSVNINVVPLLSLQDLEDLDKAILSELPSKYTDIIRAWIRQRIAQKLQPK